MRNNAPPAAEIAARGLFLVSEEAGFINGQAIHGNGGAHAPKSLDAPTHIRSNGKHL